MVQRGDVEVVTFTPRMAGETLESLADDPQTATSHSPVGPSRSSYSQFWPAKDRSTTYVYYAQSDATLLGERHSVPQSFPRTIEQYIRLGIRVGLSEIPQRQSD